MSEPKEVKENVVLSAKPDPRNQGFRKLRCGGGELARISAPPSLVITANVKGPQVLTEDLYAVPAALKPDSARKKKFPPDDDLHVMPENKKKKYPQVLSHLSLFFLLIMHLH